jgi:hypothetical protein
MRKKVKKENYGNVSGQFKDNKIKIIFGTDSDASNIFINGRRVDKIQKIVLTCEVGKLTKIQIERIVT